MTAEIKPGDLIRLGSQEILYNKILKQIKPDINNIHSYYTTYIHEYKIEYSLATCIQIIENKNYILYQCLVHKPELNIFIKKNKIWRGDNVYLFTKVSK